MTRHHVVVVGGGMSGLAAAHSLLRSSGVRVTVVERDSVVGGKVRSHTVAGIGLDAGAESFLTRRVEATALIDSIGLADLVVMPATSGVEVAVGASRFSLPARQLLGIPFDFEDLAASGIMTADGLARAQQDGALPPAYFSDDVSVGEVVRQRMGQEALDRLVEPMLAGVYAGNADQISIDAAIPGLRPRINYEGSLASGVRSQLAVSSSGPVFASMRGGLGVLVNALGESVRQSERGDVIVDCCVAGLARQNDRWLVSVDQSGTVRQLVADGVLFATPTPLAAKVLAGHAPAVASLLSDVDYASVVLVTHVFEPGQTPSLPGGTGLLVPPDRGLMTKAVTYVSQKWDWVAEQCQGRVVVRTSMGRVGDTRAFALSDEAVAGAGVRELEQLLAQPISPGHTQVVRWTDSLPQYRVGHVLRVQRIRSALADLPGIDVCGAGMDGVGIPACIASGQGSATRIVGQLDGG